MAAMSAAREQLAKESPKPKARVAAEAAMTSIEAKLAEPEPDETLMKSRLGTVDAVSATAG